MDNLMYSAKHYQAKCAKSEENCKKYAETLQNLLPNQSNNAGKYLTTDGVNPSWAELKVTPHIVVDALPENLEEDTFYYIPEA